uniref:PurM-like N-terminal domain-containing protein n=1 Tax=Hemiselmis andersenii TaxID=464988 RepID=A0A7S1E8X0_HEMAN
MSGPDQAPRLSSLSHGGGCGCKIAPKVLSDILKNVPKGSLPFPSNLLVGKETSDDAAVYKLNDSQAVVVTTDFFMPIVDDEFDFGRIAATNALSDVYAMGATPICALAIVCMPLAKLGAWSYWTCQCTRDNLQATLHIPPPTHLRPPDQSRICKILEGGQSVCEEAGIHIVGGHSIDGLECIYGLVAVGVMNPKNLKKNDAAKVGDAIVLGKPLGVGIYSAALKKQALSPERYHTMTKWTTKLNTAGVTLGEMEFVHAMTDVTGRVRPRGPFSGDCQGEQHNHEH